MKSTVGKARRATDRQVETILAWWRNRRTIADWERILGVSRTAIESALRTWSSPEQWLTLHKNRVGPGRRRVLSPAEVQTLLAWHRTPRTRAQLARELGLPAWLVGDVITRRGEYKRCCPEQHEALVAARREKLARLELVCWAIKPPRVRRTPSSRPRVVDRPSATG